ncbi:MAG: peptidase S24 [Burkholderiales bacterium]|uniref:LexA family protein n=1 Tax=Roseateles sp. TaxID=1971397 RepID=UPI000FA4EABD|nr:MAG: peptidase S24 [Burkholderiales bacterium]
MARPNNDQRHLRVLRDLYARLGCLPSYAVIAKALGFEAKNAAYKMAQRLIDSGHLSKSSGGRLAPGAEFFTLEISEDEVRAGFGADHSVTGLVQAQTLDQLLVAHPSKTVFVKVRGESMADAGILSGDVAVVETASQAVPGDIVVAEIDGDYTIKELQVDRHGARLVPHQAGLMPRRPTRTFNVLGVVKGIIRNLANPSPRAKLATQGAAR